MTVLRPYQSEAVKAVQAYWQAGGGNPLVDLATGTGKSLVLAQILRDTVEAYGVNAIVLTHVKELVEQDLRATLRLWPACPAGINSAGLGRRDRRSQVLFASIQSVHREDAYSLGKRHIIIIDEAHLVPKAGDGMYLKFIARLRQSVPDLRVVGLTATPYRLDSGRLDQGDNRIFDDIVYSYSIADGVRDGFLSPLVSRNGSAGQIDTTNVARRGGEFVPGALEAAANAADLVRAAVADMRERGRDRRGWIVFATGLDHCEAIRLEIARHGISCASVTSETMRADRDRIIRDFKAGHVRCLVSVGVLTTGFDAPHVDVIAMLRPTLSTGLYVQMLGRGTRIAPGKSDCLVLDYSGNVRRHGPVDAVEIRSGRGGAADKAEPKVREETVRAKECPQCGTLHGLPARECDDCGYVWPVEQKHADRADTAPVMAREIEQVWHRVDRVSARPHVSASTGNTTLRVIYECGLTEYSEWISIGANQWNGERAARWWHLMTGHMSAPLDPGHARGALDRGARIDCIAIRVRREGRYWRVAERLRSDGTAVDENLKTRVVETEQVAA